MRKRHGRAKHDVYAENSLDQFEAYGEYSYAYQHRGKKAEEEDDVLEGDGEEYEEAFEPLPEPQRHFRSNPMEPEVAKRRSRSAFGRILFLLILALATLIILQGTVFRLQTVYVVGNQSKSPQYIAALSGLVKGLNIFSINEETVRARLSQDHTIELLSIQKDYPGTIYLYISERTAAVAMQWLGIQYTLDSQGLVLEENNTLVLPEGLPVVTGFQVTNIRVGRPLEVKNRVQMDAYRTIMAELTLQLYTNQISELNLSDPDNLYLVTVDGITVRMGSHEYARAKIGAMRTDMAYLRQLGKNSGYLDVSIPEDAKYTPEN